MSARIKYLSRRLTLSLIVSYSHLTDYLRYLFLFKFGGTCESYRL